MGIYRGPKIVREGLTVLLDSRSSRSYPGTGNTWYDLSGNDNHASLYNFTGPGASNVGTNVTSTGSTFRVGGDTRDGTTIHNGTIPVVKVYDRVLSLQEIKANFNQYKNRFNI